MHTHAQGFFCVCNLHKQKQRSQMCVRNNIYWRIRDSDLSLLPWSCGLCIFVEQLCLVASRHFSRHLKGRSVCHASLSSASSPLCSLLSPPCSLLSPCFSSLLHAGYPWAPDQTSKQTEQQKNPSPRQGWSGLGGREILFTFRASSISLWWQRRPPRTRLSTLLLTSSGDQGASQSALTHHLLTQYTAGCIHGPVAFT